MSPPLGVCITVTTTYLQLCSQAAFRPALIEHADLHVSQAVEPLPAFVRFLYDVVGREYHWVDRISWSDARYYAYLSQPGLSLLVLYLRGTPAGYIELNANADEPGTEIVYFGIVPAFHGRSLGKHLLSVGVQRAFDAGAARVWLHTCTLDGGYALANYQARGFVPYRCVAHEQILYGSGS